MRAIKLPILCFVMVGASVTATEADYRHQLCDYDIIARQICESSVLSFGPPPAGIVLKKDGLLTVTTKKGISAKWSTCSEKSAPDNECDSYSVVFEATHQYVWIAGSHHESSSLTLISNESGKSYSFNDNGESGEFLSISPDGQCLLVDREYGRSMLSRVLKNTLLSGPRMARRNHARLSA